MLSMVLGGLGMLLGIYYRYSYKRDVEELIFGILIGIYISGYGVAAYFFPYLNESFMMYAVPMIAIYCLYWFRRRNLKKKYK